MNVLFIVQSLRQAESDLNKLTDEAEEPLKTKLHNVGSLVAQARYEAQNPTEEMVSTQREGET